MSVVERCLDAPKGYAPGNIPRDAQVVGPIFPLVRETVEKMRKQLGEHSSLLEEVPGLIALRRAIQWVVIGLAVVVTLMALRDAQWSLSEWSVWGLVTAVGAFVIDAIRGARWWVAALIGAMLAAYGINGLATRRMKHRFSRFWSLVRP